MKFFPPFTLVTPSPRAIALMITLPLPIKKPSCIHSGPESKLIVCHPKFHDIVPLLMNHLEDCDAPNQTHAACGVGVRELLDVQRVVP
jgi:hypothetical protein